MRLKIGRVLVTSSNTRAPASEGRLIRGGLHARFIIVMNLASVFRVLSLDTCAKNVSRRFGKSRLLTKNLCRRHCDEKQKGEHDDDASS